MQGNCTIIPLCLEIAWTFDCQIIHLVSLLSGRVQQDKLKCVDTLTKLFYVGKKALRTERCQVTLRLHCRTLLGNVDGKWQTLKG